MYRHSIYLVHWVTGIGISDCYERYAISDVSVINCAITITSVHELEIGTTLDHCLYERVRYRTRPAIPPLTRQRKVIKMQR